ncbi:MAG: GGDEF domain-containing protein [Campylobacterota bacterium]
MKSDSGAIVNSIASAMKRFQAIKSTMNLQKLVSDVSLGLEIFEFRYIEPNGIIKNSMFKDEIGKIYSAASFKELLQEERELKVFFFEVRDYVKVMAIYYPIYRSGKLIGIIDLSVDVSEYEVITGSKTDFALMRRKVDILNLLKSIEGSIENSLEVYETSDMNSFLHAYVESALNIFQASLINADKKVLYSSNKGLIGRTLNVDDLITQELITIDGQPTYRTIVKNGTLGEHKGTKLMLLIDAMAYTENERQLLRTALITSAIALFFVFFIARAIYYTALEQSRGEKERLERQVKERTCEIEILSKIDPLTGLWNRGYLEEMLEMEFKRARRYIHDISILLIDLDHFKHINDTFGHLAGDEVLRQVSDRIKSCLRETDFVGRYGGEEIVVILPETEHEIADIIANKILQIIGTEPVLFEESVIKVTTSIGINNLRTEHKDRQTLFTQADEALYEAKRLGRNRIVYYNVARTQA